MKILGKEMRSVVIIKAHVQKCLESSQIWRKSHHFVNLLVVLFVQLKLMHYKFITRCDVILTAFTRVNAYIRFYYTDNFSEIQLSNMVI